MFASIALEMSNTNILFTMGTIARKWSNVVKLYLMIGKNALLANIAPRTIPLEDMFIIYWITRGCIFLTSASTLLYLPALQRMGFHPSLYQLMMAFLISFIPGLGLSMLLFFITSGIIRSHLFIKANFADVSAILCALILDKIAQGFFSQAIDTYSTAIDWLREWDRFMSHTYFIAVLILLGIYADLADWPMSISAVFSLRELIKKFLSVALFAYFDGEQRGLSVVQCGHSYGPPTQVYSLKAASADNACGLVSYGFIISQPQLNIKEVQS